MVRVTWDRAWDQSDVLITINVLAGALDCAVDQHSSGVNPVLVVLSRVVPTVNDIQATLPDGAAWGLESGEAARLIPGLPARSAAAVDETQGGNGACAAPQTGAVLGHR